MRRKVYTEEAIAFLMEEPTPTTKKEEAFLYFMFGLRYLYGGELKRISKEAVLSKQKQLKEAKANHRTGIKVSPKTRYGNPENGGGGGTRHVIKKPIC